MSSLNDSEIEEIKKIYYSFKDGLNNNIGNEKKISKVKCYLIKKKWDTDFKDNLNKYKPATKYSGRFSNYKKQSNEPFNFPNNSPEFINSITTVIDSLKNGDELILESYDLIEKIAYKARIRGTKSYLNYWAGSSKIILEYESEKEILLIDSASGIIDGISKNNKIINIKFNSYLNEKEKEEIFKYLLLSRSYKYINKQRYKIQNIIEDILKEDEVKEENKSSFNMEKPAKTRCYQRIVQRENQQKEETKQEKKIENELETPKGEENKYNSFTQKKIRYHSTIQQQKEIEKPKKEEDTTNKYNYQYNDKQSENSIESQSTSKFRAFGRRRTKIDNNINNDNNKEQKNEYNYTKKNSIYSQYKEGDSIELKKEIEKLRKENQTLTRNNDELNKQNSKLNNDVYILNKNINNLEKEKNSLNRTINEKDKDIKIMNKDYERLKNELDILKKNLNDEKKVIEQKNYEPPKPGSWQAWKNAYIYKYLGLGLSN